MLQLRLATVAAALASLARAAIRMPAIFSDGMVLQTRVAYDQRPFLYGLAEPSELVTVVRETLPGGANDTFRVQADGGGAWIAQIDPYYSDAPTEFNFFVWGASAPADVTVIRKAVYGDVFLCSGQSNMNENVAGVFNASETMAGNFSFIRLFAVAEGGAVAPQFDLPAFNLTTNPNACTFNQNPVPHSLQNCNAWQTADSPTVIGAFSAACFYAALELSRQLTGNRTLGLIHASVSGTPMRQWAPPEALASCDAASARGDDNGSGDAAAAAAAAARAVNAAAPFYSAAPPLSAFPPGNSTLFNAMIAPLSRYAVRGVFWDQGESDAGESVAYFGCLFQALIESWRRRSHIGDVAWAFAQLGAQDSGSWPTYWTANGRAAQALALPGAGTTDTTGMAVAFDIGDMGSPYPPAHVHSRRKPELGRRLALAMAHAQYAAQWPASNGAINLTTVLNWAPPFVTHIFAAAGKLVVTFATLDGAGVYLKETADAWEGCATTRDAFQVAATVGAAAWVNATAALNADGASVTLTPAKAGAWGAVRYAANLWPQCAVYAVGNALPAAPFALPVGGAAASPKDARPAAAARGGAPAPAPAPVAPAAPRRVVTPRVPGAWAGGWRGRALPAAAPGAVAKTPPMGYNSWNALHCNVDDELLRKTADAFVSLGLAAVGYEYISTDDCWQADRHPNGTIIPDPARFPYGLAPVVAYVRSRGLRFGLYTAQREFTCQGRPGSWRFEATDIDTYCALGVEYVKTDGCSGRGWPVDNVTWVDFRAGISRCTAGGGRDIVLSVESCSDAACGAWIGGLANLWRTTADIQATWKSVMSNLDDNNEMAQFAGPGHWNDPDILQVGNAGLSDDEARSHFGAWAVVAAPLLVSADLVSAPAPETLAVLTAPEVIAVDQDSLGVQGVRVSAANPGGAECWARPLADGSVAALLLNRGDGVGDVTCSWAELGLPDAGGAAAVRDLWARAELGSFTANFTAAGLRSHASMLVKVTQQA